MKFRHKLQLLSMVIPALLFCSIVFTGTLVINGIVYRLNRKILNEQLKTITEKMKDEQNVLKNAGVDHLPTYITMAQEDIIQNIGEKKFGVEGRVFIVSLDKKIVYHPSFEPGEDAGPIFPNNMYSSSSGAFSFNMGEESRYCVFELFPQWRWIVCISVAKDNMFKERNEYLGIVSLISVFILLISLSLAYLFGRQLVKRLDDAQECVIKVGSGDMTARITSISKDDEIGTLQKGINSMVSELGRTFEALNKEITERKTAENALRNSESELLKLNEELENRVMERTASLEDANRKLVESIDNLHQAQSQLVESEKMAALGGLVAGIAHEINTPVGVGITASSHIKDKTHELIRMLEKGEIKKSELNEYLELSNMSLGLILSNLERAGDLIKSFKQIAVDQSTEQVRTFNLKAYLGEILNSLYHRINKARCSVTINCPDEIMIKSYPGAYYQILTNLLDNSLIHGFEGKENGTIGIKVLTGDKILTIIYSDNGRGIPPEHLKHVFEPFFTTRRESGGSGLGLHIVYNLVTQKLGGRIRIEEDSQSQTAFIIEVPVEN